MLTNNQHCDSPAKEKYTCSADTAADDCHPWVFGSCSTSLVGCEAGLALNTKTTQTHPLIPFDTHILTKIKTVENS